MKKTIAILSVLAAVSCGRTPTTSVSTSEVAAFAASSAGGNTTDDINQAVSITPGADKLLVACASIASNSQAAPTVTDNRSGTYSVVGQAVWASSNLVCFVRDALTTSTLSHKLTLVTDTNQGARLVVASYSGIERSGSDAIRQAASAGDLSAGTPAGTFTSSVLSTNPTIAVVASGDATTTPPSGWTERRDTKIITPTTAIEVATRDSGFSDTTITWGASQSTVHATVVIELNAEPLDPPPDAPPPADAGPDAAPYALTHGIVNQLYGSGSNPAQITRDTTNGSTFLILMGGKTSDIDNGPTDNKSNTYSLVGSVVDYSDWSGYGTSAWVATSANGGAGHTWSQYVTDFEEITMFEVEVSGSSILQSFSQHGNSGATSTQTSASVTTSGPATIIATWWGAGSPNNGNHVAVPNNGFELLDGYGYDDPNGYVQAWLAWKIVGGAGTYDVTWTHTPTQGAQLRLIAIE